MASEEITMAADGTHVKEQAEILVADDNPSDLRLLTGILTEHGYRVRPASGGKIALRSSEAKIPDLILLDVTMPDIDGYEVCRKLKSNEYTRGTRFHCRSSRDQGVRGDNYSPPFPLIRSNTCPPASTTGSGRRRKRAGQPGQVHCKVELLPGAHAPHPRRKIVRRLGQGRLPVKGLKKTEQTFDAIDWLARIVVHIPNKYEQLVRYVGILLK